MNVIGLTGGIGSGKSTIAKIFEHLGIKVFYADKVAKDLMHNDPVIKDKIIKCFGARAFDKNNKPDHSFLASIVFKDEKKLQDLNSIIHPAVLIEFDKWKKENRDEKYIILESAILFETGLESLPDLIISVYAPEEVRIQRIMFRDGTSKEAVINRINNQLPDSFKMANSDYVIFNDGTISVIEQVLKLHEEIQGLHTPHSKDKKY